LRKPSVAAKLSIAWAVVPFILLSFSVTGYSRSHPGNASDGDKQQSARRVSSAPSESGASRERNDSTGAVSERLAALEAALEAQNAKLDEMRRIIAEQQRTIELLAGKHADQEHGRPTPEPGVGVSIASTGGASVKEPPPNSVPADAQQAPEPLQQRLQKVEERITKLGPIRLSGDFRLRFDAILRGASRPPDPPLAHQQNVRMRYRLRLNLDAEINHALTFHGQLSTGPVNNPLTMDQDFTATVARHPFFISEAWIDYHPNKSVQLQGGRVQEVFADNSRFLFDDDVRFNGFNEKFVLTRIGRTSVELRAGQYWFSNPVVAVVAPGSPLASAGAEIGSIGRSAMLFHQGILVNSQFGKEWSQQLGGDVQVFREPNQIQLASTPNGVVFIVQPGLGVVLSGPLPGTGNATTTPGGAVYSAEDFHVARLTYRLNHTGFTWREHSYPVAFSLQVARNYGAGRERDAMLAALQVGKPAGRGEMGFQYVFSIKGANSIISQLTDDDLGTGAGVNIRTHHLRWEIGLAKNVTVQSLVFIQRGLRNSGQFPDFFVPLGAFAPRQYRFQENLVFSF